MRGETEPSQTDYSEVLVKCQALSAGHAASPVTGRLFKSPPGRCGWSAGMHAGILVCVPACSQLCSVFSCITALHCGHRVHSGIPFCPVPLIQGQSSTPAAHLVIQLQSK